MAGKSGLEEGTVTLSEPARVNLAGIQGEILPLLRGVFGTRTQIIEVVPANQKFDYLVLQLQLAHPFQKIVMKLAGPLASLSSPFDRAAVICRLVAERTDIPMPTIFDVDVSYKIWPWRYVIKGWLPGDEWAVVRTTLTVEDLSRAHAAIGHAAAQLHAIHFPAYGEISAGGGILTGGTLYPALRERARAIIADPVYAEFFLSVLEQNAALFETGDPASLCHEDLHQHNILFSRIQGQWRFATILDFEKAWAGPAESDLARLDLWRGMTSPAFWDAYRQTAPVSEGYSYRRLIYQLLWCLEFALPSPQHRTDTQQVCDALGVRLPKLFG
jgi:aminoglycoside phosphotransferase (APT) family kinase protein